MKQKIVQFLVLAFFSVNLAVATSSSFISLSKPESLPESALDDFNIFINKLDALIKSNGAQADFEVGMPDGQLLYDYLNKRKIVIPGNKILGVLRIPDSTDARKLVLVRESQNLKLTPTESDLAIRYEGGKIALVIREFRDWMYVTDGITGGWVEKKFFNSPPKTIYVHTSLKKIEDNDLWLKTTLASYNDQKKIESQLLKLKEAKPECPTQVSNIEADGLVGSEPPSESSLKYELLVKCGAIPKDVAAKDSVLKKDCQCLAGDVDGYTKVKYFKGKKLSDCRVGKFHIICKVDSCANAVGDCSAPVGQLGCLKECISWK